MLVRSRTCACVRFSKANILGCRDNNECLVANDGPATCDAFVGIPDNCNRYPDLAKCCAASCDLCRGRVQGATLARKLAGNGEGDGVCVDEGALVCPGACNGHGDCDYTTGECSCHNGWGSATDIAFYKAPDCSLRVRPAFDCGICTLLPALTVKCGDMSANPLNTTAPAAGLSSGASVGCHSVVVDDRPPVGRMLQSRALRSLHRRVPMPGGVHRCVAIARRPCVVSHLQKAHVSSRWCSGDACQRTKCFNDCSGRGVCVSMRTYANSGLSCEHHPRTVAMVVCFLDSLLSLFWSGELAAPLEANFSYGDEVRFLLAR